MIVGLFLLAIFILFGYMIYKALRKNPKVRKVAHFIAKKLFFNALIRTFIAGYLVFCVSAFMNLKNMDFASFSLSISSILAMLLTFLCFAAPFLSAGFLMIFYRKLNKQRFRDRC